MKPHKDPKCGVCAINPFERNNYFYGKQFTVRDLLQEQSYFNEKRYLINRMVHGWGVVCGLDVYWEEKRRKLFVGQGMALDCCGHEILVCEDRYLSLDDKDDDDCCFDDEPPRPGKYVLCLEHHECDAEPIELPAVGCDEKSKTEYNRTRDSYRLRLKRWEEACPKEPPKESDCPDHYKRPVTNQPGDPQCDTETVHEYLCRKLRNGCPECEGCDCVVLATITIKEPPSAPPPGKGQEPYPDKQNDYGQQGKEYPAPIVDPCTNRKLVYNNQLLFNLIQCYHGDLPHIVDFSWRTKVDANRDVPFDVFMQMIRDGITVYFDQTMEPKSLNPHTFLVCYLYRETGTGAYVRKQIPTETIRTPEKPEGPCFTATFVAKPEWIDKELDSTESELLADTRFEPSVHIEIVLRGSRIWSTNQKALDGEFLADKLPTGNGTQGGDFLDWFRVVPPNRKKGKEGKSYEAEF